MMDSVDLLQFKVLVRVSIKYLFKVNVNVVQYSSNQTITKCRAAETESVYLTLYTYAYSC